MTLRRFARIRDDEGGSVLILALGYAVIAIVLVLVCVDATSLYLTQKRLDAASDAAALAGADGFTLTVANGAATARLTDAGVYDQATELLNATQAAQLVAASTSDGVSARVTVATVWHPPVLTLFVPNGWPLQATATSRTALR